MSLAEAVTGIVEAIEKDLDEEDGSESAGYWKRALKGFARELRTALKASQGNFSPQSAVLPSQVMEDRQKQIRLRDQRIQAEQEEASREMVLLCGGISDGDMIYAPSSLPVGAKTVSHGECYVKGEDGSFHFSQEETDKWELLNQQNMEK